MNFTEEPTDVSPVVSPSVPQCVTLSIFPCVTRPSFLLGAWLSLGCLSPRTVASEASRYEKKRMRNKSTYWLIFELTWRDFYRFSCAKHGGAIFDAGGPAAAGARPFSDWFGGFEPTVAAARALWKRAAPPPPPIEEVRQKTLSHTKEHRHARDHRPRNCHPYPPTPTT